MCDSHDLNLVVWLDVDDQNNAYAGYDQDDGHNGIDLDDGASNAKNISYQQLSCYF